MLQIMGIVQFSLSPFKVASVSLDIHFIYYMHRAYNLCETRIYINTVLE